jgi:hypothetical protein
MDRRIDNGLDCVSGSMATFTPPPSKKKPTTSAPERALDQMRVLRNAITPPKTGQISPATQLRLFFT